MKDYQTICEKHFAGLCNLDCSTFAMYVSYVHRFDERHGYANYVRLFQKTASKTRIVLIRPLDEHL